MSRLVVKEVLHKAASRLLPQSTPATVTAHPTASTTTTTSATTLNAAPRRSFQSSSSTSSNNDEGQGGRTPRAGNYRSPWTILKEELEGIKTMKPPGTPIPRETDVLIVGGGAIGSSVAYWFKQNEATGGSITVLERDPVYTRASTMLSAGGIRHQFSVPENVELSLAASDFLRNIKEHLSVIHEDPPDVQFNHQGYLMLAEPRNAEQLANNVKMQNELGARVALLTKSQLAEKFPWMNLEGIECGSYGLEGEGWFDPWSLVRALKQKNLSLGVKYIHGELTNFEFSHIELGKPGMNFKLDAAVIRTNDGQEHEMKFAIVVNCAGPWAADVAEMAKIGLGEGDLEYPLPVEPRKRFVYVVHCPEGPLLDCPFVIDNSGSYVRREGLGQNYICGSSPSCDDEEPDIANFDVDYGFYEDTVWPNIANRLPAFNCSKLKSAWAGYYDYNVFDQNLIIGPHPHHRNFIFANGLSGHGLQHSVAVGKAVKEIVLDSEYKSVNLSRFHFDRLVKQERICEEGIV